MIYQDYEMHLRHAAMQKGIEINDVGAFREIEILKRIDIQGREVDRYIRPRLMCMNHPERPKHKPAT